MTKYTVQPTGTERTFGEEEIIVSKTDLKGRLTYTNRIFLEIADYEEKEVLGQPHSMIRHPNMPRCVFKLLWETLESGKEIFAYVINMAKNGDHYWVIAHVTPTFDSDGNIVGYHSNRRVPDRSALEKVKDLYAKLLAEEERHSDRKEGMLASTNILMQLLEKQNVEYDEFVLSL